jgi:hypothetical protein
VKPQKIAIEGNDNAMVLSAVGEIGSIWSMEEAGVAGHQHIDSTLA